MPLAQGTILENRYRIRGVLGEGGMSRVYLADDLRLKIQVALKENLQTSPESHRQFTQEAEMLARLSHPNLPRVIDFFTSHETGKQYFVMDYIAGEDLDKLVKRVGPLNEATALSWIRQILGALEYLHSQTPPIIHRDVKPSNIKITPEGKAVLVDFGIAKIYDARGGTMTGARAVTPGYAAPEQYGLRTDARSDIYSLGATLYTMLTGRVPPEAPLRMSDAEKLIAPRELNPNLSTNIESVLLRAMELSTTKRLQNVSQLRTALEGRAALSATGNEGKTVFVPRGATSYGQKRPIALWPVPVLAAVFLVVVVGIVFLPSLSSSSTNSAGFSATLTRIAIVPTITRAPTPTPFGVVVTVVQPTLAPTPAAVPPKDALTPIPPTEVLTAVPPTSEPAITVIVITVEPKAAIELPTLLPTATTPSTQVPTLAPTKIPAPATKPPPTNTAVPNFPPNVYVTKIEHSPKPKRNDNVTFTATFLNTTGSTAYYNWLILLYDPAKPGTNKGFGESPATGIEIPTGENKFSVTYQPVTGPSSAPCKNLYMRAGWKISAFDKPIFPNTSGEPATVFFDVCP